MDLIFLCFVTSCPPTEHNVFTFSVNAKWRGARYVKGGDYSLTLLYDVNGYIAGIQSSVSALMS